MAKYRYVGDTTAFIPGIGNVEPNHQFEFDSEIGHPQIKEVHPEKETESSKKKKDD